MGGVVDGAAIPVVGIIVIVGFGIDDIAVEAHWNELLSHELGLIRRVWMRSMLVVDVGSSARPSPAPNLYPHIVEGRDGACEVVAPGPYTDGVAARISHIAEEQVRI